MGILNQNTIQWSTTFTSCDWAAVELSLDWCDQQIICFGLQHITAYDSETVSTTQRSASAAAKTDSGASLSSDQIFRSESFGFRHIK